jgi:hypothetical protein
MSRRMPPFYQEATGGGSRLGRLDVFGSVGIFWYELASRKLGLQLLIAAPFNHGVLGFAMTCCVCTENSWKSEKVCPMIMRRLP